MERGGAHPTMHREQRQLTVTLRPAREGRHGVFSGELVANGESEGYVLLEDGRPTFIGGEQSEASIPVQLLTTEGEQLLSIEEAKQVLGVPAIPNPTLCRLFRLSRRIPAMERPRQVNVDIDGESVLYFDEVEIAELADRYQLIWKESRWTVQSKQAQV